VVFNHINAFLKSIDSTYCSMNISSIIWSAIPSQLNLLNNRLSQSEKINIYWI
jgi:hypothetical protein